MEDGEEDVDGGGGSPCPECGEFIENEAFDEADEKWGGQMICPHCSYWFE